MCKICKKLIQKRKKRKKTTITETIAHPEISIDDPVQNQ